MVSNDNQNDDWKNSLQFKGTVNLFQPFAESTSSCVIVSYKFSTMPCTRIHKQENQFVVHCLWTKFNQVFIEDLPLLSTF